MVTSSRSLPSCREPRSELTELAGVGKPDPPRRPMADNDSTVRAKEGSETRSLVLDSPKAALADYIVELDDVYYRWYERATNRNYALWAVAQGAAIASGLA